MWPTTRFQHTQMVGATWRHPQQLEPSGPRSEVALMPQRDTQRLLASSDALIKTEWQPPASIELVDLEEAMLDQLDHQGLQHSTVSALQQAHERDGRPSLVITIPPQPPDQPASMSPGVGRALLRAAISELLGAPNVQEGLADADWLKSVKSFLLPVESFRAGFISMRIDTWQMYFETFGWTAKSKAVLHWLEHGLNVNWVPVQATCQQRHPRFAKRLELVKALLTKTVGESHVASKLSGAEPQHVHFQNRVSVGMHFEFVAGEIQELLRIGVIKPRASDTPITVINGMGVVGQENRKGKKRLIVDARYNNLFDAYESFSYEKLSDVPQYLQSGDYIMLTDFKSGYHQLKMHLGTARFLGIHFEGQVYYFAHLPFGLSSACKAYTVIMGEVYRPLRGKGQRMSFLIDDAFFAFPSSRAAKRMGAIILKILTALGFFLSLNKCQLLAKTTGKFLGLIVNPPGL